MLQLALTAAVLKMNFIYSNKISSRPSNLMSIQDEQVLRGYSEKFFTKLKRSCAIVDIYSDLGSSASQGRKPVEKIIRPLNQLVF